MFCRKENEELQERLRKYKEEAESARETAEKTMRTANEERDRAISGACLRKDVHV